MSIRLSISIMACVLVFTAISATASDSTFSSTRHSKYRALFKTVAADMERGRTQSFEQYQAKLKDYPLYPYLVYAELAPRLHDEPRSDIESFHKQYPNSLLDNRLTSAWLNTLANKGLWNEYVYVYQSSFADNRKVSSSLQCNYLSALIATGKKSEAERVIPLVWLTGSSLDADCDTLFKQWAQTGQLTQDLIWQRIQLALEEKNSGLAFKLSTMLNASNAPIGKLMVEAYNNPAIITHPSRFAADNEYTRDAIIVGLLKYLRVNQSKTISLWEQYKKSHNFNDIQTRTIEQKIALYLANEYTAQSREWLKRSDPHYSNDSVTEWRVRSNLQQGDWAGVLEATERFSPEMQQDAKWQYWQATALTHTEGGNQKANEIYEKLTTKNGYHNFLAADVLNKPRKVTDSSNSITNTDVKNMEKNPAIQRAVEFYYLDDLTKARSELNYALEGMSDKEHLAVAHIMLSLGWYDQSIRTANNADLKDALKYRFPDVFRDSFTSYAKQNSLKTPWVFAVARQESMFVYDAKSPVGALGLMQVMPATAKQTATKNGIAYSNTSNLLEPQKNIQIGSAYLRNMLDNFDNDPVLATAAYNAGPGRVKEWLQVRSTTDDIWVEIIPFKETRQYVQNVMGFSVLYGHRLNMDKNFSLPPVSAAPPAK